MKELLSKIMKRAWEIKKEDRKNVFGMCLRMAWKEAKALVKEKFTGYTEIQDAAIKIWDGIVSFQLWEKAGRRRIYANDQRRRTIGYIDLNNNNEICQSDTKYSDLAFELFLNKYEVE